MWPVWVLLWKHSLARKRRYCLTFMECICPIGILVLLYFITKTLLAVTAEINNIQRTEPFSYDDMLSKHKRGSILFTPETKFTNRLMDEVGRKLNLTRLDHLPNNEETGYFPFSNDMALSIMKYSKGMTSDDAIVIFEDFEQSRAGLRSVFQDMDSDMWRKRLNYTIRMKNNIITDEYEPTLTGLFWRFGMGHHEDLDEPYEAFMRLQWALDTSYLRLRTGANVSQNLTVQKFPPAQPALDMRPFMAVMVIGFAAFLMPKGIFMTYYSLMTKLYEGKNSGMHELVKMAGVSWEELAISHVLDLIPIMLIYVVGGTLLYELPGFLPNTASGYITIALALEFLSVIALVFALVYLFNITEYAALIFFVIFIAAEIGSFMLASLESLFGMLIPHGPFVQFWFALGSRGIGPYHVSIGECYLFMALQTLFLAMVAWYLSRVRPGKYGQALPWNFLFVKDYWCVPKTTRAAPTDTQIVSEDDQQYFEKAPVGLPVGIHIIDVYKSFGKDTVLHGVNLTVYRGEITVLLGHNGAGKTTLLNIITGFLSATAGRVLVEGKDTVKQTKEVRKLIGLCTQENIFFAELTVLQHTMFFAMLKGSSFSQARASAIEIFGKLNLSEKAGKRPDELSGGMKRRVQLSCALVGSTRVLMLDEPTSGIDIETRRELWDLLLSLRGDRTVLLTTHFMEEADALGDRIAALHRGHVRCNATSMFLKRAIGTGYRLSFTTIGAPQEAAITAAITAVVPDATVRDKRPNGITYNLPAKDTSRFPDLFVALEDKRSELRIDTIGVGKSTLDDVFMKLCSDEKQTYMEDLDAAAIEPAFEKETGAKLYARQFAALLFRQWRFFFSKILFFLFIVFIIVCLLYLLTESSNNKPFGQDQSKKVKRTVTLDLDLYAARPERRALVNADKKALQALRMSFRGVEFEAVPDVTDAVLRAGMEGGQEYLVGIELSDTSAKALYTTTARHAAPVALNTLSNALAARMLSSSNANASMLAEPRQITARHHPLRDAYVPYNEAELKLSKDGMKITEWAKYVVLISLVYLVSLVKLPNLERAAGTRHALVMAGAPRVLVWGTTLIAHLAQALIVCAVPVLALAATVDKDSTFDQRSFLLLLCLILILGFLAVLGLMYLVSSLASEPIVSAVPIFLVLVCTLFTTQIPEEYALFYNLMKIPYVLVPAHALTIGLMRAGAVASLNAYCNLNRHKCPTLVGPGGFEATKCCGSSPESDPWNYWSLDDGAGWAVIVLAGQTVAYCALTLLADGGALGRLRARCCRHAAPPPPRFADNGAEAQAEAVYVTNTIKMPKEQIPDAILCHNLQKNFPSCCKKSFFAVNGLSFSVKKGECFGLLGVNGAGKSTTFSMLTGAASSTGGDIFANGHHVEEGASYMRTFSYCPQFSGVDGFLTGRQNLAVLLTMRGLPATAVTSTAAYWIEEVDLTESADKRVSLYSGGMARRLAAAAALCQAVPTTVLDEPTAGVDPVARRRMHVALLRARRNRSIIVASHSMDEMEALCHRIAIMSGGVLRALGSAAVLKAQFGKGYFVVFKLTTDQDAAMLGELNNKVSTSFECELREEHRGILSYHVKESLRYSELFTQLEELRAQFPALVEDYTVTETTLEEVFLILAKEARATRPPSELANTTRKVK